MDTLFQEFPNSLNGFKFDSFDHNLGNPNVPFGSYEPSNDLIQSPPSSSSSSSSSSSESVHPSNKVVLKYINDMLMEEDLEGKTCMLQDCLALQAAEKSFYDVLGQDYPHSLDHCPQIFDNSDDTSLWIGSSDTRNSFSASVDSSVNLYPIKDSLIGSPESVVAGSLFGGEISPFTVVRKGTEDGGKFQADGGYAPVSLDMGKRDFSPDGSRGRKNHQRADSDYLEEERSNKHSALGLAESEQSDMFDDVLLCPKRNDESGLCDTGEKSANGANPNGGIAKGSNGRTARGRRQGNREEVVDLTTLLTQCAQSVSISDQRTATELLKQIRQHSSAFGDGNQRLAHYFAKALETRLAGLRTPVYSPMLSIKTPVSDVLKAYQVYVKACPFKIMSNFFANHTIFKLAEKASRLHIVDFGVLYGFQWPCLIQRLSRRPGGPPELRITGIELPQPGFRPAERVEETGHRLRRYCERFHVPFKYHAVAQKWETIKFQDLNIDRDEMTIVNCLYRLRNLPDDTVVSKSARDTVLKLIRKMRPEVFIHGVINGTYNAPFFATRFREALFHYYSLFDMLEVNVPREDEQRLLYEEAIFGRDIMNVIACEGAERVERPETYKQWQVRSLRAGFRQLPLDKEILKKVRSTVRSDYHKDFVVDEDGQWMLQGWKGRVVSALSVWKPVEQ